MKTIFLKLIQKEKYKKAKCMNPHKHWHYVLVGFFVALATLVIFSFYFLYLIKNDNLFSGGFDSSEKNILVARNQKLLNNVKNYFNSKNEKMNELQNINTKIDDPRYIK